MKTYTPRPCQVPMIEFMGATRRCALWAGMGVGKTPATLTYLDACYRIMGESAPTLVLGPKRVARDTWTGERDKWRHLQGLDIAVAIGDANERIAALRRDVPIVTMNYENLPWLVDHYTKRGRAWPFKRVVADEASKLRGFRLRQGGATTAALGRHAHKDVTDFVQLTGTPASNHLAALWGQMHFIDAGQRLGRTYQSFMDRWFQSLPGSGNFRQVRALPHAQEEIQHLLRDVVLTIDPKDWFDLREPLHNPIRVRMPDDARRKYREMEKEMFIAFESGEQVEAFAAGSKSMKCLQLASGAVYLDETQYGPGKWKLVHDAKLDALESITSENDMPLLVSIGFKSSRERILAAFPKQAVDLATDEGMAAFRAGRALYGVAHPASLGHGIDGLQDVTCQIAFFDHLWDAELRQQIVERIGPMRQHQSGHDRLVTIHDIIAEGTLDEDVVERHKTKATVQEALLAAMKQRGT